LPVSWTLDNATEIVRIEYAQPYTFDEWRWVSEQLRSHPQVGFRRDIGFLTNRADLGVPSDAFTEAALRYAMRFPAMLRGRKIAFVARTARGYEVARWQSRVYEDAGAIATPFLSRDAAEIWLRERRPDWWTGACAIVDFSNLC
jgi:hypothetical protein